MKGNSPKPGLPAAQYLVALLKNPRYFTHIDRQRLRRFFRPGFSLPRLKKSMEKKLACSRI